MANENSCSILEKSVGWCEGKTVVPGIKRRVYYTHKANITKWPTLPKDALGRPTSSVYEGSFELAEGKCFHYVDLIINKSGITSEAQGEVPSQTQLNKFVGVHPGTEEEASMLSAYFNNSDVVLLPQQPNGKFRVIGSEMSETLATVAQDSGQGPTGTASTTVNAEATDLLPAPFYEGEIVTEDGVINPQGSGSGN